MRRALQVSTESLAKLAARYGLNEKTVAKWRGRATTQDAPMGPKKPVSTVLSPLEEAAAVTFRQHTQLPLDDCLYALQDSIPHRSRSVLHRLFQRHGVRYRSSKRSARLLKRSLRPTPLSKEWKRFSFDRRLSLPKSPL